MTRPNSISQKTMAAILIIGLCGTGLMARADGKGSPWEDLYDAMVFNLKLFHFQPKFQEALNKAIADEKLKLKPGESKTFRVLVKEVGNAELLQFVALADDAQPAIYDAQTRPEGPPVMISKSRYGVSRPTVPVARAKFDEVVAALPAAQKTRVTYEDYLFAVQAGNLISGMKAMFAPEDVEKGGFLYSGDAFIDLLDPKVYAAGEGIVILTASAADADYVVYNVEAKKEEKYSKKEPMKKAGNAVYLWANVGNAEYTVVYKGLRSVSVKVGTHVKAGDAIGEIQRGGGEPSQVEVWRVGGAKQRFVEGRGNQDGPYSVWKRQR